MPDDSLTRDATMALCEAQRLAALARYDLFAAAAEPAFDEIAAFAAHICETSAAVISFVDDSREWIKSSVGLAHSEIPREHSFGGRTISGEGFLVVPDAVGDERFASNPLVAGEPHIRFYAGCAIVTPAGERIGTLAVLDPQPRVLAPLHRHSLRVLSHFVMARLELRRQSLELASRERLLDAIVDSEPECVKLLNRDGTVRMMNRAGLTMIDAESMDQIAGQPVDFLVAAEHRSAFRELAERVFRGEGGTLEFRITGLKGTTRWLETHAVPLRDQTGQVTSLLGITRDITERKRADEALRESERNYRMLFQQATEGIVVTDASGRFLEVNPALCSMVGYSREELMPMCVMDFVLPEEQTRVGPEIERLASGDVVASEWRGLKKDGTVFVVEVSAKRLDDGRILAFVRDVTERTTLQARLLHAQTMESIGRLAGGVAHDFNNLLTVITGMADLVASSLPESDPRRDDVEEIRTAGERAAALTRQLLAVSRRQILKPEVLNLSTVISGMLPMLSRLLGEQIQLEASLPERIGSVRADPGQIAQVILNLAVNARDAMPDGGVLTIAARDVEPDRESSAGAQPIVMLEIADSGVGIDSAVRDRIFEPFFTTKDVGRGTGLGLSTVYGIVQQSGGTITVDSARGRGTTFQISFPRVDETPRSAQPEVARRVDHGGETILLVEDERALRQLAARVLRGAGYTVIEAGTGDEALAVLDEQHPALDLVFTDVVMPGMSGHELAARVTERQPGARVLYASGYAGWARLPRGVLDDPRRFVHKPYTPDQLKRRIRSVLDS